jgi:co-chaperonin GroES (HSP10)
MPEKFKLLSQAILKIRPIHTACLVQLELVPEKIGKILTMPDSMKQKEKEHATHGYLIAHGTGAFCECDEVVPIANRPFPGDRISFVKFRGVIITLPTWLPEDLCSNVELRSLQDTEIYNFIRYEDLPEEYRPKLPPSIVELRKQYADQLGIKS